MEEVYSNYLLIENKEEDVISCSTFLNLILIHLQNGNEPTIEIRRELITNLLNSLSKEEELLLTTTTSNDSTTSTRDESLLVKLSILKHLGRSQAGSEELSRDKGLRILLNYSGLSRVSNRPNLTYSKGTTLIETDPLFSYESESLRCSCNCLMLHPNARELFPILVLENINWIKGMISLLGTDGAGFLAGRILFLLTSKQGQSIIGMSEEGHVVKALSEYAERYLSTLNSSFRDSLTSGSIPTPADTLREHFKMAYNLMLQYGRHPSHFSDSSTPSTTTTPISISTPLPSNSTTSSPYSPSISLIPPTPREHIMNLDINNNTATTTTTSIEEQQSNPESGYGSDTRTDTSSTSGGGGESATGGNSRPVSPSIGSDRSDHSSNKSFIGGAEKEKKRRFWKSTRSNSSKGERPTNITSNSSNSSATTTSSKPPGLLTKLKDVVTGSPSSSNSKLPPLNPNPPSPSPISTSTNFDAPSAGELSLSATQYFLPLFQPYLHLSCLLPLGPDPKDPSPLLRGALNTLLNFPVELESNAIHSPSSSWLQSVPGSINYYTNLDPLPSRLLELLSKTCDAQFPTNVRPIGIKNLPAHPDELIPRGMGESAKAEEILGPVMLLLRKITMISVPAETMRQILLPDDIDRTTPLEKRTDLIGHLVRLLSSILLPNTAYGVGEFLYNLCDRDPTILCQQIGYGNASGFLQNRGELIPPPPSNLTSPSLNGSVPLMETPPSGTRSSRSNSNVSRPSTPTNNNNNSSSSGTSSKRNSFISGSVKRRSLHASKSQSPLSTTTPLIPVSNSNSERIINPITGAYEDLSDQIPTGEEMTQEEKERESERLFVLFERMARSGVIQVDNPIEQARAEGKFVETSEEAEKERRELEEKDRLEEEEVERELKLYKEKKLNK